MTFAWLEVYGHYFVWGTVITILLLFWSALLGFPLAVLLGLGRISRNPLVNGPCLAVTSVIRGTPLLVQIYVIYYGLGDVFGRTPWIRQSFVFPYLRDAFWYVVVALTISTGAYVGEIIRGALLAVPRGEIEAARAYGFHGWPLLRRVWLPRALQSILPTLAGETVLLLKATALGSVVTIVDVLGAAGVVKAQTYRVYEPLLLAAVIYYLITMVIEYGFRRLERRYARAYRAA
ncbi:ABC transporter permease [Labrys wisconsinensis]|uniref:Polar amino acid transport system permease protein n=1 Tax=Labrys wisconsinensis TaxID=425677 RepID=A0ABU0J413_9HYPH|nr:ABC transporter permease subunit [Labrys wisconsinensis]MDQ0469011.1 polar amino acid transport system permease protein [Labrys wisconsinensis]